MTGATPANWYPDPSGRHELRYWDGAQWTDHVASHGRQEIEGSAGGSWAPTQRKPHTKTRRAMREAGLHARIEGGGGTLFTEPVLIVDQKAKLFGGNAEYAVYDQQGHRIGAVQEVGHTLMRRAVVGPPNRNRTVRLQVIDGNGQVVMVLTRPAKLVRSNLVVRDANGGPIGQILQRNFGAIGRVRFALESDGQPVGVIDAEGWGSWDFSIQDVADIEVARITKTWRGLMNSPKRDKYVVQIHRPLDDPLRSLVIAAALAIDTGLRQ